MSSINRLQTNRITQKIIGCAYTVGKTLKYGYLEKVYENALIYEFVQNSLKVEQQKKITVRYKKVIVGEYSADLVVESLVLVELKTAKSIEDAHIAQCLNYLTATGLKVCLLINFSPDGVQIKRLVNNF